jgi:hypothetical protein
MNAETEMTWEGGTVIYFKTPSGTYMDKVRETKNKLSQNKSCLVEESNTRYSEYEETVLPTTQRRLR